MCARVHLRACVRACVRVCVRACVREQVKNMVPGKGKRASMQWSGVRVILSLLSLRVCIQCMCVSRGRR